MSANAKVRHGADLRGVALIAALAAALAGCADVHQPPMASSSLDDPEARQVKGEGVGAGAGKGAGGMTVRPAQASPVPAAADQARRIALAGDIVVFPDLARVEIGAITCLDAGWIEQVACAPGTREHESLLVVPARPSDLHAALLLAGFRSGAPGKWTYDENGLSVAPPQGDPLAIKVRYQLAGQGAVEEPIGAWIHDAPRDQPFSSEPWVFAGSLTAPNPPEIGGEHYVADLSGSIIGLVTFGDEVIGWSQVIADQEAVQDPEWQVNSARVPPRGTKVTLVITRAAPAGR